MNQLYTEKESRKIIADDGKKLNPIQYREAVYGSSLRTQGFNNEIMHHIALTRKERDLPFHKKLVLVFYVPEVVEDLMRQIYLIEMNYILKEYLTLVMFKPLSYKTDNDIKMYIFPGDKLDLDFKFQQLGKGIRDYSIPLIII